MNRRYPPTHLSHKKLQKEILCDIQLSSLTFLSGLTGGKGDRAGKETIERAGENY